MKSLLITGSNAPFVSPLIDHLLATKAVKRIIGIDCRPGLQGTYSPVCERKTLDCRQPELFTTMRVHAVDTVIHAAFARPPAFPHAQSHEMNIAGTMKLLNTCESLSVKRLLIISCTTVYGAAHDNPLYMREDFSPQSPISYGPAADKREIEQLSLQLLRRNPTMSVTILRCAPLIGGECRNMFTDLLSHGVVPVRMGFDPLIQFLHLDDLVRVIATLLTDDVPGIYNVAGSGALPLRKLLRLAGCQPLPTMGLLLSPMLELLWNLKLTSQSVAQSAYLTWQCTVDTGTLRERTGYTPIYSTEGAFRHFLHMRTKQADERDRTRYELAQLSTESDRSRQRWSDNER